MCSDHNYCRQGTTRIGDVHENLDFHYLDERIKKDRLQDLNKLRKRAPASIESGDSDCSVPVDDLLLTNSIHNNPQDVKPGGHYFKYISTHINMSSNSRVISEFMKITQTPEVVSLVPHTQIIPTPQVPIRTNIDCPDPYVVKAYTSSGYNLTKVQSGDCVAIDPMGILSETGIFIQPSEMDDGSRVDGSQSNDDKNRASSCCIGNSIAIANQIETNMANNVSNVIVDSAFLGFESVLEQVYHQSGFPNPTQVPLTNNSPYLVKARFVPQVYTTVNRNENAVPIGGLREPVTISYQSICVTDDNLNRYVFKLDRRYTNIKLVKMISSNFQQFDHIVNASNNEIVFQIKDNDEIVRKSNGDDIWTYLLPIGNLTVSDISSLLQEDINASIEMETAGEYKKVFEIKVDERRNLFDISTVDQFTFTWEFVTKMDNFRSMYQMLGFSEPKQSSFTDSFRNREPFNLRLSDYILIEAHASILNQLYDTYTQRYFFTKIYLDPLFSTQIVIKNAHIDMESVIENSDLSLDLFDISFFDQWGNSIFFGNREFSITILMGEYTDKLSGVGINTRRGVIDTTSISKVIISQALGNSTC